MIFNFFRAAFRRSPLEAFVLFTFVLFVVEELVERGFVCPCMYGQNITLCVCYALVPGLAASAFTFHALGPDSIRHSDRQKRERIGYSVGSFFIWLALFFLDGRYVACASSYWEGNYSFSEIPLCSPYTRSYPSYYPSDYPSDYRRKTQTYLFASEVTGFVLLTATMVALLLHCRHGVQGNAEVTPNNMEEP